MSRILQEYEHRTPQSLRLHAKASGLLPNGVTHISCTNPYPIYVTAAAGSRKRDVDGNEYIDYFGGHGALILATIIPPSSTPSTPNSPAVCTTEPPTNWRFNGPS